MDVKEITVGRKFNMGNYETESIAVTINLDKNDKATEILAKARQFIEENKPLKYKGI